MNVLMNVIEKGAKATRGASRNSALFGIGTARSSAAGFQRLRELVRGIPVGATRTTVDVIGAFRADRALAQQRAQALVRYLKSQHVVGSYLASITTKLRADTPGQAANPDVSSPGIPLSTVHISFEVD